MDKEFISKKEKAAKVIAIIAFILFAVILTTAVVSDFVVVSKQIAAFLFAIFAYIFVFLVGIILMVISIMFIFGIYLLADRGFWPLEWAREAFKSIIADYPLSPEQIEALYIIRIIILSICILIVILSIISLILFKVVKKEDVDYKGKQKAFAIVALIMSILGLLAAIGVLFLLSILK